jgi:4-(gamma-glutamylamino)butanal dehydrogenase
MDLPVPPTTKAIIDGFLCDAVSGEVMSVASPIDGQPFAEIPLCGEQDLDRAVAGARKAFDDRRWQIQRSERHSKNVGLDGARPKPDIHQKTVRPLRARMSFFFSSAGSDPTPQIVPSGRTAKHVAACFAQKSANRLCCSMQVN